MEVNSGTLETLQKRVGRIVIKTSSSDTAMKALKWPSLSSSRDKNILKLVRKCIHGRCPQYFNVACYKNRSGQEILLLP